MNRIVLNYIQEELGTEPKPLWTEIDEQAFEKAISDIDLRQFPNLNYEQFKDLAFEQLYQTAETEILESAFELVDRFVEKFERGGVIRFDDGGSITKGTSTPKSKTLSGEQMMQLIMQQSTGNQRKDKKGLGAIANMIQDNPNIQFTVFEDGRIDVSGTQGWNEGSGTGRNFANRPSLLDRILRGGENKAQRLYQELANSIASGKQSELFKEQPKKEDATKEERKIYPGFEDKGPITKAEYDALIAAEIENDSKRQQGLTASEYQKPQEEKKPEDKKKQTGGSGKRTHSKKYAGVYDKIKKEFADLPDDVKAKYKEQYGKITAEQKKDPEWYIKFHNNFLAGLNSRNAENLARLQGKTEEAYTYTGNPLMQNAPKGGAEAGVETEEPITVENRSKFDVMLEGLPYLGTALAGVGAVYGGKRLLSGKDVFQGVGKGAREFATQQYGKLKDRVTRLFKNDTPTQPTPKPTRAKSVDELTGEEKAKFDELVALGKITKSSIKGSNAYKDEKGNIISEQSVLNKVRAELRKDSPEYKEKMKAQAERLKKAKAAKKATPKASRGMLIPKPKTQILQIGGVVRIAKPLSTAKETIEKGKTVVKNAAKEYGSDAVIGLAQGLMGGSRKAENTNLNNALEVASMLPVVGVPAQIVNSLYRTKQEYDAGDLDWKDIAGEISDIGLSFIPGGKAAKGAVKLAKKPNLIKKLIS